MVAVARCRFLHCPQLKFAMVRLNYSCPPPSKLLLTHNFLLPSHPIALVGDSVRRIGSRWRGSPGFDDKEGEVALQKERFALFLHVTPRV